MKKLILTEKPSVARDFARSLSIPINRNIKGHFEGPNYIITWALGHLFSPFKPEEYDPTLKKWSIDNLPILPEPFQYSPIAKTKDQLKTIFKILKRSDLEEIIIATDAGREGELIARIILENAPIQNKNNLSFSRFWSSQALSDDVIQKGLQERKSLKSFDRLYHAGKARQIADWLVGMNLSRAATLKWGDLFSIGRVQTAVLWLLVKRNQERKNFKEEKYWKIQGHFEAENISFTAYWFNPTVKDILKRQHILKETELKAILKDLKKHKEGKEIAVIKTDKETEKREPPPPLYSLTDLQQKANRVYGFTAKQTLSLAQELYEKDKCLSYPRTDSQVLGEKNFPLVKNLLNNLKNSYSAYFDKQDASKISLKNKRVFNDSLLTDHHALIPLKVFRGPSQSDKGKIYDLVLRRFIMSFSMDFLFKENNYSKLIYRIIGMLFAIDQIAFRTQDSVGIRLEDLKKRPKATMRAFCSWLGVKESPTLYEMTAQGKKWWGDPSSPDFKENKAMSPFDETCIKRPTGTVFSEKDQFVLRTLFYPFSVRFKYREQNQKKFESDLKEIRPLFDDLMDFERELVKKSKADPARFKSSIGYLLLRASFMDRWKVLNELKDYPNMITPLQIDSE